MSTKTFSLTIARVDEPVFAGEASSLTVPGVDGEMVVLADHEPFISPLASGTIRYVDSEGAEHTVEAVAGTLEVAHNNATVLL